MLFENDSFSVKCSWLLKLTGIKLPEIFKDKSNMKDLELVAGIGTVECSLIYLCLHSLTWWLFCVMVAVFQRLKFSYYFISWPQCSNHPLCPTCRNMRRVWSGQNLSFWFRSTGLSNIIGSLLFQFEIIINCLQHSHNQNNSHKLFQLLYFSSEISLMLLFCYR